MLRRHELIVGLAVAERLGDAVHVPFDGAQRSGRTTLNCVSSTSSIDERHRPAIGLLERRELPDRQQRLPLLLGDARHEPARRFADLFLLGDHLGEVFDHALAGQRFDLLFQLGFGLAERDWPPG